MFSKVELAKKTEFLDKAKVAREERANERQRDLAAVKIQASCLSFGSFSSFHLFDVIVLLVRHRTCDSQVLGLSLGWAPLQAIYTCVPLSPSSVIWYQPRGIVMLFGWEGSRWSGGK